VRFWPTRARPARLLVLACCVAFLDGVFISAVAPLLPAYVDDLDIGSGLAGVLSASYSVGLLMAALPAGIISVKYGPRPALLAALVVLSVSSIAFGFATTYPALLVSRGLEGIASAFAWTAMLGWLIAVTDVGQRARLFGVVFGAAFAGFTLGPVLGGLAATAGTEAVFGAVGLASAAICLPLLRTPAPARAEPRSMGTYGHLARQPLVRYALWLQALPGLVFGAVGLVVALRLSELGGGPLLIAAGFFVAGLFQVISMPLVGRWIDVVGTAKPIRVGLLASSVAALALLLPEQAMVLAILFPFLWVLFSIVLTPATVVLTSNVEAAGGDASFGFAMMNLAFAPGAIVGAVMAGVLRDLSGDLASMALVSAFCAGTVLLTARGFVPTSDVPRPRTDEA